MKASIIIRTKNEEQLIGRVLTKLLSQTEKDFEIIVVDSGSTDNTISIIKNFEERLPLKIFDIRPKEFTYPFACNYGAGKSSGLYLIYLSGHSIPLDEKWLENGLSNFDNDRIAGVYGNVYASEVASFWEKLWYLPGKFFKNKKKIVIKIGMGVLGNTNSIIRKNLWEKYKFDEKNFADGGEDGDWAKHFLNLGYVIISDPKFSVFHSHGLGLRDFTKQYLHWRKVAKRFTREN